MSRLPLKTVSMTVRVTPEVKQLLEAAAAQERRSLANMVEVLVVNWCEQKDIKALSPVKRSRSR